MSTRSSNPFKLMRQRRFAPFFVSQFLSAFNDNMYKNALILFFAMQAMNGVITECHTLINFCAGLFILPFFLFSGFAGQLADKYEKSKMTQWIKIVEISIVIFAGVAFYLDSYYLMIIILFLLGVEATFFSPVKYSYLPEYLEPDELMKGNGMLEMGTFAAILLGTVAGTLLMGYEAGRTFVSLGVVGIAIIGYFTARQIPSKPAITPDLKIDWNIFRETLAICKLACENKLSGFSILGISWFWLFSALFIAQIPEWTLVYLGSTEETVSAILIIFALSIGIGSLLCDKITGGIVELGMVPLGLLGLTVFMLDLSMLFPEPAGQIRPITVVFREFQYWRLLIDTCGMGIFSGFYLVPLYTLLQRSTKPETRARVIAANNVYNAIFMVAASGIAIITLNHDWTIPQLFLATALTSGIVTLILFALVPEYCLKLLASFLVRLLYRVDAQGFDAVPEKGPAILLCNHVSFLDPILILAFSHRPVRFVYYYTFSKVPVLGTLLRLAKTIPVAERQVCLNTREAAFEAIYQALDDGDLVCVFPEGTLTSNGEMNELKPGILRILNEKPVPVVPIAVKGLWGSFFSQRYGRVMRHVPRHWFQNKIGIQAGSPIEPTDFNLHDLADTIRALRGSKL